jgi:Outer membrane protein beta-barrel domain
MYPGRSILCSCLLLVAHLHLAAQSGYYIPEPKVFEGALVAGANFTQIDGDSFYGYHKVGLDAGGMVYIHFTSTFGLTMELAYSQKGSRGEQISGSVNMGTYVEKYFMNVNYVEVPVTLHYITHGIDMEAGGLYGRLVSSHEWVLTDGPVVIDPVANRFNTSDVDWVVGLSRRVYKQLFANARFEYSLTSIRPAARIPQGFGYGNQGQYNNMFALRLIYVFR